MNAFYGSASIEKNTAPWNHNDSGYKTSAPTVALALKWMRDVKGAVFGKFPEYDWETSWIVKTQVVGIVVQVQVR
ncbi:MAG: hypothetical protein FWG50_06095 [Kiritimatiellaeota bacterium]|nr:hypothetical protein [Kiritimatiellota bacterium]